MLRETSDFGRIGQGQSENLILALGKSLPSFGVRTDQEGKTFCVQPAHSLSSTFILGSPRICAARRDSAVKFSSTKSVVWPPRRRVPGCNKMAIKDAWRFDKSQWALKAGIASALVLATIIWYALECGSVF